MATGNLSVDHRLVSYRTREQNRALRLVYNSLRADPRPILSAEATIDLHFAVPDLLSARLRVVGIVQADEIFTANAVLVAGQRWSLTRLNVDFYYDLRCLARPIRQSKPVPKRSKADGSGTG